jgi:lysozyme family protein
MYWNATRGEMLPSGADILLFDVAVVDGPGRAARLLQRTVGAEEDGIIGPQTLRLAAMTEAGILLAKLTTVDDDFLQGLATYRYFGCGWERRLNDCVHYAAGFLASFSVGISTLRNSILSERI